MMCEIWAKTNGQLRSSESGDLPFMTVSCGGHPAQLQQCCPQRAEGDVDDLAMGSGASSPAPAPATPFKALSLRISRKDTHKVPLNIAVASVIVVQRYVRGHLARKKYKQMRSREKIMAQAATDYLNSVRMQRVKTDRHSEVGMLRRSWMEGSDSPMRGMGSFSFDSTNHHHHDSAAHSISGTLSTFGGHRDRENSLAAASRRFSYDDHNLLHTQKEVDETDEERALIYPFIGFVIKAKLEISGRKVFINLSHSPKIQRAAAATLRTWTEEKRHDDDGELIVEEVLVIDLVIPSSDFDDRFVYKDGVGLVPTGPHVKDHLGDLCVMMLNSIDHCPDPLTPPISSLKSSEDYKLSPHTNWPKIKRGYVGNIFPMIYEPSDPSLSYCQPFRLSRDLPPVTTQVVAAMCPPEVRAWMSIALSSIGAYDALSNIARVG